MLPIDNAGKSTNSLLLASPVGWNSPRIEDRPIRDQVVGLGRLFLSSRRHGLSEHRSGARNWWEQSIEGRRKPGGMQQNNRIHTG
ncbi:hypothetical protein NQZ68_024799 [Dissostichus eleginoides]|nr:hypothetical protein NQZ68_024799 [Dissostichus eleginoides]